ncbi:MAG: indole-3-glycerol phosphate synthase TrpC [Planctomycetota bacterium]
MPAGVRETGSARLDTILRAVVERRAPGRSSSRAARVEGRAAESSRVHAFADALRAPGLSVIAECKRRSPSAGTLADVPDVRALCERYRAGGAAALSILTERDHFGGAPEDLAAAAELGLPCLRKDFVVDVGMVDEAHALGASAVLLLAVCVDDVLLAELRAAARDAGLAALVEIHDEEELERALAVDPDCLGVNARDLRTFDVDLGRACGLLERAPAGPVLVAESGIRTPADAARVRAAGADAALVGEALVRANAPEDALRALRAAAGEVLRAD